jgi:hypothetical protein
MFDNIFEGLSAEEIQVAQQLLRDTVSSDLHKSTSAKYELSKNLVLPLKKGVVPGDIVSGFFTMDRFEPGVPVEYPLDWLVPGTEKNYVAYVVPNTGRPAQKFIEGDFLTVKTYDVATSINWARKYAQYARWDIVGRAMMVGEMTFVKRKNDDGFHALMAAGVDRAISVYDGDSAVGYFSKRLISSGQTTMRRGSGGNSTSVDNGRLTHVAISPEGLGDVRGWDGTQLDEITRREIFIADGESPLTRIFGVNLIDIDEFGVGQEYQKYYTNVLGASLPGSKEELALGLDLRKGLQDSFYMPYIVQPNGQETEVLEDPMLVLSNRAGYQWRRTWGTTVLDTRRVLVMAF